MTAAESGALGDAGEIGGDGQIGRAFGRVFFTMSGGGFPVMLEVSACPAYIDPGAPESGDLRADVLEVIAEHTYGRDATCAQMLSGEAEPMDTEYAYCWPIDYWADGEPTAADVERLEAAARAHVANLPTAWLDAMPAPEHGPDCATCAAGEWERHAYRAPLNAVTDTEESNR